MMHNKINDDVAVLCKVPLPEYLNRRAYKIRNHIQFEGISQERVSTRSTGQLEMLCIFQVRMKPTLAKSTYDIVVYLGTEN